MVKLAPVTRPRIACALAGSCGSLLPNAGSTARNDLVAIVAPPPTILAVSETVKLARVPTLVMFGCAFVYTVPAIKLLAT